MTPPPTHPSIRDGWFHEINSQWPGQAMSLKVSKILHIEQSKFQDVLVFESETYGNVLVLDGVIQCTERDEFSYQEMIAHLPLNSHPNPKQVLVIGGGDGGVVREVLKHKLVQKVVLVDIDEAVVRVSKQFLPHMSSLLSDPRVKVIIGDGFQYLKENTSTFDVIITDSSDPVGPAQSLFQPSYFELIKNALAPGGTMCCQGECLWIHLPLIGQLRKDTAALYPTVAYAFTTIPTYPSGQIGFTMASVDSNRDLKTPLREVKGCRYYNLDVHRAAFVLPEFGRAMLEEGKDITPVLGARARKAAAVEALGAGAKQKKVLLLGSGFVARPCAEYLARSPLNSLTIACRTLSSAEALCADLDNTTAISLDVNDTAALDKAVSEHDLVISLIPYTYHAAVIKAAIKSKTHVVTTSYVSPAIRELDEEAKKAGIIVMNEIGLDPGIDHLYAVKLITGVHAKGGKIKEFHSYCGGLPAPEAAGNPLGYKFSWSPRGALLALLNNASFISGGKQVDIPGKDLMSYTKPYYISPPFAFVAYPNRNSVPFREFYNIPEAQEVVRGTLRYQGFPELVLALSKMGWLDEEKKEWLSGDLTWAEVTARAAGANDSSESSIISRIEALSDFPNTTERTRVISGLRWIGLFSTDKIVPRAGNLLDTLCGQFEKLMGYAKGERDFIMLQHKFVVEWKDGKQDTITSTLEYYGNPVGHSAMAYLVGLPCGIATQLIIDGKFDGKTGVLAPYSMDIVEPIKAILESEGVTMIEKTL